MDVTAQGTKTCKACALNLVDSKSRRVNYCLLHRKLISKIKQQTFHVWNI